VRPRRVFLARHGETEWNLLHRLQGRTDTPLSPLGEAHAEALAALLGDEPLAAIYTSTLCRTRDTARPLGQVRRLEVQARPELDEMSYGILEGHVAGDPDPLVQALWAERKADPLGFRAPGGETYAELQSRLAPFVAEIGARHARDTVLIVGHRATNRVLWGLLLGRSLEECLTFKHKHDRVLEIRPGADPECIEHRYAPVAPPRRKA